MRMFVVALVALACPACAREVAVKPVPPSPATTEADCIARSGIWGFHGATEVSGKFCALPTTDGGTACTDNSQCQGHCLAPAGAASGSKAVGACASFYFPGTCFNMVEAGRALERLTK
jgi:hypothetical protein